MSKESISIPEKTIDYQFKKLMGSYINDEIIPRADKVKHPAYPDKTHKKVFKSRYRNWNAMSAYQNFILELDCLSRINETMWSIEKVKHFPILVDYDIESLEITISHNGESLNQIQNGGIRIERSEAKRQVIDALDILDKAKVVHLDMCRSGKNIVINNKQVFTFIDFNMAQANGISFNYCVEQRINEHSHTLTKDMFFSILERNKNIILI